MFSGIRAQDGIFLSNLGDIENRISKTNQQVTSGIRVATAADDPSAVMPILQYQSQIDRLTQVNTNLQQANTEATAADAALQSATTIMDQLVSIASRGITGQATANDRADLGLQVQQLQNQLVSIANTSMSDRFVFGGDNANVQPYTFDWSQPSGVVSNSASSATMQLSDGNGSSITSGMTAAQIFDLRNPDGTAASGNIFQAVHDLGQALGNNDQAGIQTALDAVREGAAHLGQASVFYGNVESWITQVTNNANNQLSPLQQALSAVQDVDMPAAITQLTSDQTALQVSLSAHASLSSKTLFDYLG